MDPVNDTFNRGDRFSSQVLTKQDSQSRGDHSNRNMGGGHNNNQSTQQQHLQHFNSQQNFSSFN